MKACKFILNEAGHVFVPRPTSVFSGMARHRWLKTHFGREVVCTIASPNAWDKLVERCGSPKTLIEENGEYRVEEQ